MATGPVDDRQVAALRAERDALTDRCARAEAQVARLSDELAQARGRLSELEAALAPISIFEDEPDEAEARIAGDGSDQRVLSMVLGATAVVAGMVALLALLNGNLRTPFGLAIVLIAIALAYAAARTRVRPVQVSVRRGVVYAEQGDSTYRFDLRNDNTRVQTVGRPGDAFWQVRFLRRGRDPFVVDADMVDPHDFLRDLRAHRPEL